MEELRFLKKFDKKTLHIVNANNRGRLLLIVDICNSFYSLAIVKSVCFKKKLVNTKTL